MYPINLNMTGHKTAVFGGGRVALRKIRGLMEDGALVTIIAPEIIPEIEALLSERVVWLKTTSDKYHWDNGEFILVFAATDDFAANRKICKIARFYGALTNNITEPENGDFYVPASVKRGNLNITVGTGGASPALARLIRQDIEKRYHEGIDEFLQYLGEMRQKLVEQEADTRIRQELWRELMQPELLELVLNNRLEQAKDEVRRKISCAGTESSDSTGGDSRTI